MKQRLAFTAAAALCVATLAGCSMQSRAGTAEPTGDGQRVEVETLDFAFSPRTVVVEPDLPLTVVVHNAGRVSHTFTADGAGVEVVVGPSETREVTLVPPDGRLGFFCRFHHADGMKGALCPEEGPCAPQLAP